MKKIATKIAKKLQNYDTDHVLMELPEYRELRDILFNKLRSLSIANDIEISKPANNEQYLIYVAAHNLLTFVIEIMSGGLPGFEKHNEIIEDAMEDYMPSYPPMSPITKSFFSTWVSLDLRVGKDKESFTSCVIDLHRQLGIDINFYNLCKLMNKSRLGVYKVIAKVNNEILLEELFTGKRYLCFNPNQGGLIKGMLCLIRLLAPMNEKFDHYIIMETPYVLVSPQAEWEAFFKRTIKGVRGTQMTEANYEEFMKNGLSPLYWIEYVFQGYANHTDLVIYLKGVPDIGISRPYFFNNSILPEGK